MVQNSLIMLDIHVDVKCVQYIYIILTAVCDVVLETINIARNIHKISTMYMLYNKRWRKIHVFII